MKRLVFSREAERDLIEIEDYTATTWGDKQAEKYLREIEAAFAEITKNPETGRMRPDIPAPYLCYSVGSHLIIYRVNQAKRQVEVLNIVHPAMDIKKRLMEALKRVGNKP